MNIFKNTPNLNNIVQSAATDVNIETKVTPIWEKKYFQIIKSINVFKEWSIT